MNLDALPRCVFRCLLEEVAGFVLWGKQLDDALAEFRIEVNGEGAWCGKAFAESEDIRRNAVVFVIAIHRGRMALPL